MDAALAHLDDVLGPAQAARRSAADLHMGFLADRLKLEHRIESRHLQHADVGHFEEIGDGADRGFRHPALMLFLDAPQDCDHRGRLATRRIFFDLRFRPGEILFRERKARGLQFLRCEAADGHRSVSHCTRRTAFALSASIRASQNALAVPNTL